MFDLLAIQFVGRANFQGLEAVENIEFGQGPFINAAGHDGMVGDHGIEPAAAARASGGGTKFTADAAQLFAIGIEEFGGEWSLANAGGIGLEHTEHAVHAVGGHAGTRRSAAAAGVGAGHKRVGAEIDVEHDALGALKENILTGEDGGMQQRNGVADQRPEHN